MLLRSWVLRQTIQEWLKQERHSNMMRLQLTKTEWHQVAFLIKLLSPFKRWTEALSATTGASIHKAWFLYNLITGHILRLQASLATKDFEWKHELIKALDKGFAKLMEYRGKATGNAGLIYGLATVIDPATRLGQFKVSNIPK
jgi:hypothetical protein